MNSVPASSLAVAYLVLCHEQGLAGGTEIRAMIERAVGEGEGASGVLATVDLFLQRPTRPALRNAAARALRPYLDAEPAHARQLAAMIVAHRDAAMDIARLAAEIERGA